MRSARISGWTQFIVVVMVLLHSTFVISAVVFPQLSHPWPETDVRLSKSPAFSSSSPSSPAPKMERRADLQLPVTTTSAPTPTSSTNTSAIGTPIPTVLPENEPVPSRRVFPYTPMTGANNSLYLTPNVTSREGLVEIKIGLLLPYSLPNNLTQQLTYRYILNYDLQIPILVCV